MSLMSMFPGGGGTNNQPLKAPTNLHAEMNTVNAISITWTDPENEYAQPSGALIGEWMFTRIVRKIGSAPVNANDGELIVESAVKNQYQTSGFIDTNNIATGETYYYAAFAFTTSRVSSPAATYQIIATWYDPILNNNSWTMIHQAFVEGVASSLWSKGDTKTDGNGTTFSLELLTPSSFQLTDGGTPYAIFLTNKVNGKSPYKKEGSGSVDSYDESTLRSTILSKYNGLSNELKSFIHPMNFTLHYGLGGREVNGHESAPTKVYSDPAWPLGDVYRSKIIPTLSGLDDKRLSLFDYTGIWFGDCYYTNQDRYYGVAYRQDSSKEFDIRGQNEQYSELYVLYGFAFGKVGS